MSETKQDECESRFHPKNLIIEKREKVDRKRYYLFGTISVVFWLVFSYIMRHVFVWIGWILGWQRVETYLLSTDHDIEAGIYLIKFCFMAAIFIMCMYMAWSRYNKRKFGGKFDKRRKPIPNVSFEEVAEYFDLNPADLFGWSGKRVQVAYFDDDANVTAVEEKECLSIERAIDILDIPGEKGSIYLEILRNNEGSSVS